MPIPVQICLTLGPLAIYFLILGVWQSGRDAKVVSGALDFALLALAVGGLLAFGPIGVVLIRLLFPGESVWAWLALPTTLALVALVWAPKTRRRVVVYNVSPDEFERVARAVADHMPGRLAPTLRGYEDRAAGRGFWMDGSRRGRTAVVEAFGRDADAFAAAIADELRERLRGTGRRSSPVSRVWFALSALVIWAPMIVAILSRPHVRAALRALLERLHGG
jgi:hypothetical protein